MIKLSLKNPEAYFGIKKNSEKNCYGCEQEWYDSDWQKLSGCGPTTACNLLFYLEFTALVSKQEQITFSKEYGLMRMQELWEYVTPTEKGIPTTKMFSEDFLNYAKAKNLNVTCHTIDLYKKTNIYPKFREVVKFIETAMLNDYPVAFLNLNNGEVNNLDAWHWVTIISLEYEMNENEAYVNIIDEGLNKKIDLKLWYSTTTRGGGFVYFEVG